MEKLASSSFREVVVISRSAKGLNALSLKRFLFRADSAIGEMLLEKLRLFASFASTKAIHG